MLRRLLISALVLAIGIVPTQGQDKDKKVDDKKVDDKKVDKKDDKKDPAPSGGKVLLKWKLEKGKTFYQKQVTETKQTMKVMNNDVVQTQKQTFYFSWTPESQMGDKWVIKQKIEGVAMDIDIGNQKIAYDSTAPNAAGANNPLGEFFKALVGSTFEITLDTKTMKVEKVSGREDFLKKLVNANPQMKPLLDQILSDKALAEMTEPTFAAIPGTEEAKGAKWERKSDLDMGPIGKYINVYKYTFEGKDKDDKYDKIKVETTLTYKEPTEPAGAGAGNAGLPFKIKKAELKSTSATGTILFDAKEGRIAKSDMKLDLSGTLSIEIGGQTTEVALTQTQSSTTETSDKSYTEKKP